MLLELKRTLARRNVFLESIPETMGFLAYAPLSGNAMCLSHNQLKTWANHDDDGSLQECLTALTEDALSPDIPLKTETCGDLAVMYVIPNFKCNFKCTYCYAASARNTQEITAEILENAIVAFLSASHSKHPRICLMGGGEPLLSWNRIHRALNAIRQFPERSVQVSVITNGSILTEEFIQDCKDYDIQCNVSYDIMPDLQETQRGNFELVRKNIHRLLDQGIRVRLRATITPQAVRRQPEMIEELNRTFQNRATVILEPVTSAQLIPDQKAAKQFYSDFYQAFMKAYKLAQTYGITLSNSFLRAADEVQGRFCRNLMTLLPDGKIIRCPCFASPNPDEDTTKDDNYMGEILGQTCLLHQENNHTMEPTVGRLEDCDLCIAKWHCAGGCEHNLREYPKEVLTELCKAMRLFTTTAVILKLDEYYRSQGQENWLNGLKEDDHGLC